MCPDLEQKKESSSACIRYFCPKPGKLVSIQGLEYMNDNHIYSYEIQCGKGDEIKEVKSSLDRCGYVIVTAENPRKSISIAENLINALKFETE